MQNLLSVEDLGTNCNHFASEIRGVCDFYFFLCESKISEINNSAYNAILPIYSF